MLLALCVRAGWLRRAHQRERQWEEKANGLVSVRTRCGLRLALHRRNRAQLRKERSLPPPMKIVSRPLFNCRTALFNRAESRLARGGATRSFACLVRHRSLARAPTAASQRAERRQRAELEDARGLLSSGRPILMPPLPSGLAVADVDRAARLPPPTPQPTDEATRRRRDATTTTTTTTKRKNSLKLV
jgi:hypothetical protein